MSELANKVLGIDLGTTNSVLAVIQEGRPVLLPIAGKRLLRSVVGISPEDQVLVGDVAYNQWIVAPERTVRSIKRKMGSAETVEMAGQAYSPQEISAFILRTIKEAAQEALGDEVKRAVITVPAYFNETQRQATLEAGEIAGLQVERIINEPTAAALAHGYGLDDDQHLRILVYDLGGGTFDVSIIELNYGVIDVLATAGDNHLGGDDFDERLATAIAARFAEEHEIDLSQNQRSWARLLQAAEQAKIELSSAPSTQVNLEYIAEDAQGNPLHIHQEYERWMFENLIEDMLLRTVDAIAEALKEANLKTEEIDRVLLVGGSTRIPAVWELVSQRLGQDPHGEIDPDASVALGAAVQGAIIAGDDVDAILVDVTPLSLGISTATFSPSGRLLPDVFATLIRRNTTIPVQNSRLFTTLFPEQTEVEIKVYQGEEPAASNNTLLGEFMVMELEPNRPDGLAEVTVNFALDINGILEVTVTDRKTSKRTSEQLKASRQRLSPEEISQSQARLAAAGLTVPAATEAELDASTQALIDRALALLQTELEAELAANIEEAVQEIYDAAAEGDEEAVEEGCGTLIDLLMEAEE